MLGRDGNTERCMDEKKLVATWHVLSQHLAINQANVIPLIAKIQTR